MGLIRDDFLKFRRENCQSANNINVNQYHKALKVGDKYLDHLLEDKEVPREDMATLQELSCLLKYEIKSIGKEIEDKGGQ